VLSSDEIAEKSSLSRATVIHHIAKLRDSGIVIKKEKGYALKTRSFEELTNEIEKDITRTMDKLRLISRFVQHRELMPRSEVAEMFDIDLDEVDSIIGDYRDTYQEESNARDIYDEEYDRTSDTDLVLLKDTYMYIDDELMRFVVLGNTIVYREEADCIPFACITPMIMPHRHIGRSYADLTSDIQMIKSTLIRGQLDNMYLANNGRYAISDRVNLDDMLTSRPGGIVRVNGEPGSSIMPLQQAPFPQSSFAMVEYMDSMKEKRTGLLLITKV